MNLSLLLLLQLPQSFSASCLCSTSPSGGLIMNCSSLELDRLAVVYPANLSQLLLQSNRLSTVPPGHFDRLAHLRVLDLSQNPFHCGCNIRYLRAWLLRNRGVVTAQPTCASPASLAGRDIVGLSDSLFSDCSRNPCARIGYNLVAGSTLGVLIALLLWCLRLVKGLTFILGIDEKHVGLEAESLRSLKPKHRASLNHLAQGGREMDRPLINMSILPQIDTLHTQHNTT